MAGALIIVVLMLPATGLVGPAQAVEREKLLSDPWVFVTFTVFQVDDEWRKMEKRARGAAAGVVKELMQEHAEHVAVHTYLALGLTDRADFFSPPPFEGNGPHQIFFDVMGTELGRHLKTVHIFNGMAKKTNYVPRLSEKIEDWFENADRIRLEALRRYHPRSEVPNGGCWIKRPERI